MNKRRILILILFSALVFSALITTVFINKREAKEIHIHAGFSVFQDNKQIDFSDFRYMKISPCNTKDHNDEEVDEQLEKAHLHDQVGDVVHVHRENAQWGDLFENINYEIDYKDITAFINGNKISNLERLKITQYDSLIILVGENDEKLSLSKAVKKSHIQEVVKRSENCGS